MSEKDYDVTIPLDDYDKFLITSYKFNDIIDDFMRMIQESSISWNDELNFKDEDMRTIIKKHGSLEYKLKLKSLKKEKENE